MYYLTRKLLHLDVSMNAKRTNYCGRMAAQLHLKRNEVYYSLAEYNSTIRRRLWELVLLPCWLSVVSHIYECIPILMFPRIPDAQSPVAKWLRSFIWKKYCFLYTSKAFINHNEPLFGNVTLNISKSCRVVLARYYRARMLPHLDVSTKVRRINCCGQIIRGFIWKIILFFICWLCIFLIITSRFR